MSMLWCTVKVKNMDESIHFYEKIVGLDITSRFQTGNGLDIAFLGKGETKLELIYDENLTDITIGKDISIGFEVESVDDKIWFLNENDIDIIGNVISPNPHTRFFYIKDPNGLTIQFIERNI